MSSIKKGRHGHATPPIQPKPGLLEGYFHTEPQGSLIQAVSPGVSNLRYVHERTILDVVGAGSAGLYGITRSRVMHFVPNVKHVNYECEVPSFPESKLLCEAEVGVENSGAS